MTEDLKNGLSAVGKKQCMKELTNNNVRVLYLAKDADKHIVEEFERLSGKKGIDIVYVNSKAQLGKACGIEVSAAVACTLRA